MTRFLIEVPHEATMAACLRAIEVFHQTGSHFLTHADWGCKGGDHKAWILVQLESHEEAVQLVPPAYRAQAKIVQLNSFTASDLEGMRRMHPA